MSVSHVRNQFHTTNTFLHINVNTSILRGRASIVLSRSGVDNDKEVPLKNTHKTEKHI
jgi:hypothetical protein